MVRIWKEVMRERSSCVSQKWQKERAASVGVRPVRRDQHQKVRQKRRVWWPDEDVMAVLIDGDHNPASSIGAIQSVAERLGPLSLQWVYGNWASGYLKPWQQVLSSHRLEARRLRRGTFGKNGADIALTVDAMLLYGEGVRKFVLVASDSDYTPLVEALCALGCSVLVIGKTSTPLALQQAASAFRLIDHSVVPERQVPVYTRPFSARDIVLPQADTVLEHDSASDETTFVPKEDSSEQVKRWVLEQLASYEPAPYSWVQVPRFRDVLRIEFSFRPKAHGYKHLMALLEAFPDVFELRFSHGQAFVHEVRRVEG